VSRRPWIEATTLGDLLDREGERSQHDAVVFPGERMTYPEFAARAQVFSRRLLALGVGAGDKVGILLHGCVDYLAAVYGAAKLGAVPVPVNARFKSFELGHVIANSDMRVLITSDAKAEFVDFPALLEETFPDLPRGPASSLQLEAAPALRQIALLGGAERPGFVSGAEFEAGAGRVADDEVWALQERVRIRDTGVIMYTSGTTAAPKGAMLSHEALVRHGYNMVSTRYHLTPEDRVWTPLPLFHIGGIAYFALALCGRSTFIHPGYFSADVAIEQLESERVTVAIPAFETLWLGVLNHSRFERAELGSLRMVFAVGAPERLRSMQERMPWATQVSAFGSTEACSHLSLARTDDPLETRVTTGGHPLPGMEVRTVDPETGEDAGPNRPGEILYRGYACFDGYYNAPEETARAIDDEGWFHSGDLGRLDDDGRLTFLSRLKDMLKVGGENVGAAEIEGFLGGHDAVDIVQVVGTPDARYDEVPVAFVQLKQGAATSERELIEYCVGRISTFKVPRYVRIVDEWPMSGTKIKKHVLRERIARELEAAGITEAPRIESPRQGAGSPVTP
jgi:fatty-acyl-CoA synthase